VNFDAFRKFCLSLPNASEDVQWVDDLLFRVGGKIFASYSLDPAAENKLTFKCTPERAAELLEHEGVERAPYVGRYHWVAVKDFAVLGSDELRELVRTSYEMVAAKPPVRMVRSRKKRKLKGKIRSARGKH